VPDEKNVFRQKNAIFSEGVTGDVKLP